MDRTNKDTITINGRDYNRLTGMPMASSQAQSSAQPIGRVSHPLAPRRTFSDISRTRLPLTHSPKSLASAKAKPVHQPNVVAPAATVHRPPQRSQTLLRKVLPKPERTHELPAEQAREETLLQHQLASVGHTKDSVRKHWGFWRRHSRLSAIMTSGLAVLLLGGYLTYTNINGISLQIANSKAGIAAKLPSYYPQGYSLQGPITYSPGQVVLNYKSTEGDQNFILRQTRSNWDSQALLDNYVAKKTDSYLTYQQNGLTIYAYDNDAAWVNGGLLYSIEGNTPLSSDQILHFAGSL